MHCSVIAQYFFHSQLNFTHAVPDNRQDSYCYKLCLSVVTTGVNERVEYYNP